MNNLMQITANEGAEHYKVEYDGKPLYEQLSVTAANLASLGQLSPTAISAEVQRGVTGPGVA